MKIKSFQKKRRAPRGGLFVFHSKTRRRKKHRVAAGAGTADLGSEVPNLGVARALFVILVLHVAAIAAIFIHNRVTSDDSMVPATGGQAAASVMGAQGQENLPVVRQGEDFYFVATGDTYERIARLKGVDINALRDLNDNVRLKAGRILRIPVASVAGPNRPDAPVAAVETTTPSPTAPPVAPTNVPATTPAAAPIAGPPPTPAIMVKRAAPAKPIRVIVEESGQPASGTATKVTPNARPAGDPPAVAVAVPVAEDTPGGTYKVKRGDTAWKIAQRHKVTVSSLLKENGISDARKMRWGMTLKIPAN